MKQKFHDSEMLEEKRRKSTRTSGVLSFVIGGFMLLPGLFFLIALKSIGGFVCALLFALLFIGAGIYFFNQIKIEERRLRALDDPNSRIYKKRQRQIRKKQEKYLKKAEKHGGLRLMLHFRTAVIWGLITLGLLLLTVISLLIKAWVAAVIIADVSNIVVFVSALSGKAYRDTIKKYAEYGLSREDAENDFASSRLYRVSADFISVSSKFLLTVEGELIPVEDIVWVYSGYDIEHKYDNGQYSHTERKYAVLAGLESGETVKAQCPEELCALVIDDIKRAGISVTAGYAPELKRLFEADPLNFRNTPKAHIAVTDRAVSPDEM